MIDLHCHILPGVDDGAADLDEAMAMCLLAAEDGCTAMIATPHLRHERWWNDDRRRLEALWQQLQARLAGRIDLYLGGEIAVNSQSSREMELLPDSDLLPLAGSRYLLLECDIRGLGPDPGELIHELVVAGWVPILAHPERIPWLGGDLDYLEELVEHGALVQLTAMSITGAMGRMLAEVSRQMLDADLVHFVASDAHDTRIRRPGLSRAFRVVAEIQGEAVARRIFEAHPRAVLENRPWQAPGAANVGASSLPSMSQMS